LGGAEPIAAPALVAPPPAQERAMADPDPQPEAKRPHAHQPDGTDSSAEWDAQIADENLIPDEDAPPA
jgi:hypothetical protein